jgi:hypothetical protein
MDSLTEVQWVSIEFPWYLLTFIWERCIQILLTNHSIQRWLILLTKCRLWDRCSDGAFSRFSRRTKTDWTPIIPPKPDKTGSFRYFWSFFSIKLLALFTFRGRNLVVRSSIGWLFLSVLGGCRLLWFVLDYFMGANGSRSMFLICVLPKDLMSGKPIFIFLFKECLLSSLVWTIFLWIVPLFYLPIILSYSFNCL